MTAPGSCIAVGPDSRGTLGCFAQDSQGRWVALCNFHVLYDGDSVAGTPVYTLPGLAAPFGLATPIGHVGDDFLYEQQGDAALVVLNSPPLQFTAPQWPARPWENRRPHLHERVLKVGAATGLTTGIVTAVDISHTTRANGEELGVLGFEITTDHGPLSARGDSGAVWIAETDNAIVGLHFAGVPPDLAYACYFGAVLGGLHLTL